MHPSTRNLPQSWVRSEEPYDFRANPRGNVHVLASFDTRSYTGHLMGADHPIAWCQDFEGGRSWYTALGHNISAFSEPLFLGHILGGIEWAAGGAAGDCGATEESRYEKIMLDGNTDDPLDMDVDSTGRVFYVQRAGKINVYDPGTQLTTTAATLSVLVEHTHGMHGIVLDPSFATNKWLYIYYSPLSTAVNRVSRFTFTEASKTIACPAKGCCSSSARSAPPTPTRAAAWPSTPPATSTSRPATTPRRAAAASAPSTSAPGSRTMTPSVPRRTRTTCAARFCGSARQADGTYTIPAGNLFAPGTANTRPEIYTMGTRNPYRISVDPETNYLYWGDVGPDASADSAARGPMGYDEFNQARTAGNYGWPHCIGANLPYVDYNFATGVSGPAFNCAGGPVNNSPNNTGLTTLPAARGAWLPYPYGTSATWPELGSGGRLAIAGPAYHYDAASSSAVKFPQYYDDTMFIADWTRNAIFEVKQNAAGQPFSINRFMPHWTFLRPIDMEFGPDGSMYVIEWGTNYGGSGRGDPNLDSGIYKINYVQTNDRAPIARGSATPTSPA